MVGRGRWVVRAATAAVLCALASAPLVPAAAAAPVGAPHATPPTGCRTASFTAVGGYYSSGQFFREPGDTVTLRVDWCAAAGRITGWSTSYTTTLAAAAHPRFTTSATLVRKGRVIDVGLSGNYVAGVINNVGTAAITGTVTASGHHRFADVSGGGG